MRDVQGMPGCALGVWHLARFHNLPDLHARHGTTPREKDKLLIFTAALLAERRQRARPQAQPPEAVALISPSWKARATARPSRR